MSAAATAAGAVAAGTVTAAGYGYDPVRVLALRRRTAAAIDELDRIRCDDPLADDAVRAVRLLRHNLEGTWLPLLDAICASRALVTWRRALGPGGGPAGRTAGRLAELLTGQLGATGAWVETVGEDHLSDEAAVERLGTAATGFVTAWRRGGELGERYAELRIAATDVARRARDDADGAIVGLLWVHLGPDGVDGLARAIDATHAVAVSGLTVDSTSIGGTTIAGPSGIDGTASDSTVESLVALLGALAVERDAARRAVVDAATTTPHLAGRLAAHHHLLDDALLVAVAADVVGYAVGADAWRRRPRPLDLHGAAGHLLGAVAGRPPAARALLGDTELASRVAVHRHLDPDPVEAALAAALVTDGQGDATAPLTLLAALVDVAATGELTPGARRGVARGLGAQLPALAPQLDRRLPVDVPAAGADRVIRLGDYDDLARLVGQVVDDVEAQGALGLAVAAFRSDQLDRAARAIADGGDLDATASRDRIAASLADVTRVLVLVERGADARNDLLAFRHAAARRRDGSILGLVGNAIGWYAPGAPLTGRVTSVSTRAVSAALGRSRPPTVPDTGLHADAAVDGLVSAVALPLADPRVRSALGLDRVPGTTWDELDDLVDRVERTDDPDERSRLRSRIRALVAADPDLDAYVELLGATGGEASLG